MISLRQRLASVPLVILVSVATSSNRGVYGCSLCPDGSTDFNASKHIPFSGDLALKCEDLQDSALRLSVDNADTCNDIQMNAPWCECPGVMANCRLCPNGENPPNPDLLEPFQGFRCSGMDYFESLQVNCGISSILLGIDAPTFCDCPAAKAPVKCELCPGGKVMTGKKVVNFLSGDTCDAVEHFFNSLLNMTACNLLIEPARKLCCQEGYQPPPCTVCKVIVDPNSNDVKNGGGNQINPDSTVFIPGEGEFQCRDLIDLAPNVPSSLCAEFQDTVQQVCCQKIIDSGGSSGHQLAPSSKGNKSRFQISYLATFGIVIAGNMLLGLL